MSHATSDGSRDVSVAYNHVSKRAARVPCVKKETVLASVIGQRAAVLRTGVKEWTSGVRTRFGRTTLNLETYREH